MSTSIATAVAAPPEHQDAAGQRIFPVFLVVDTSWSMAGDRLDAAAGLAPQLLDVCLEDPTVRDKVRVELIEFNNEARVVVPSARASDVASLPTLQASGGTHYGKAFTLLRQRVEEVCQAIRADGFTVLRPVVFLLSDGEPTDGPASRDAAFTALTGPEFPYWPNVCMFGVGEAGEEAIGPYRHGKGIAVHIGGDAAAALARIVPVITRSVISTASSQEGGLVIDTGALDELDDVYVYG